MKNRILTPKERLDEIRVYIEASPEFQRSHDIRHAFLRLCDLVEAMSEDISFLQAGEEGEMVSYGHRQ
ncbi:MAG TPA: hypothetical protein VNX25_10005 [Verrucomicrobiae bacterium]|nr:hypothetical protein [Verrucomicrobiae bacterium]